MPIFRCDYIVAGDLVIDSDAPAEFVTTSGTRCTFRNGKKDSQGHISGLVAIVIGRSDYMKNAESDLRNALADALDVLSFVTQSRFMIERPYRLIEWEPRQRTRQIKVFHAQDARYPPEPDLAKELLDTFQAVEASNAPDFTRTAMSSFRNGLLADQFRDQFMHFWLALEIVAVNTKSTGLVPTQCSKCAKPLTCECGEPAMRLPMAKQAINEIISVIAGSKSEEVSRRQFTARNTLMHGGSIASVEAKTGKPMSEVNNELGSLCWYAILSTITFPETSPVFILDRQGDFGTKRLIVAPSMEFSYDGDSEHPTEAQIPTMEITLKTRFGEAE